MGQGDLAAHPRGRRVARTGLPAADAQTAPGHRQIRTAAHFANSSRARCMTDTDHGRLPEEYWIRHITHHRMCARLSDAVPVRGIRLYFPAPHEPRAASGHGSDRTQRARAAVGPLLKILRTLCTTIDL